LLKKPKPSTKKAKGGSPGDFCPVMPAAEKNDIKENTQNRLTPGKTTAVLF